MPRPAPRPIVLVLHEICHALRRHGAERLICSPSDPGASSRPAAIAAALVLEPGPFSYPAPGPIPVLVPLVQEARRAHGRAAAEALRAALSTTACAMLDDLVRTRPQAPRSGTARLVCRSLGPFRMNLEDGLPMPRALMEIRP